MSIEVHISADVWVSLWTYGFLTKAKLLEASPTAYSANAYTPSLHKVPATAESNTIWTFVSHLRWEFSQFAFIYTASSLRVTRICSNKFRVHQHSINVTASALTASPNVWARGTPNVSRVTGLVMSPLCKVIFSAKKLSWLIRSCQSQRDSLITYQSWSNEIIQTCQLLLQWDSRLRMTPNTFLYTAKLPTSADPHVNFPTGPRW